MPGHVFLSHSSADAAYAARLAAHLGAAGIPVWVDDTHLRHGEPWERAVCAAVDSCTAMIVVMSPAAGASPHVANEIDRARRRGVPLLPVLLAGSPLFALGTLQLADCRDGSLPGARFLADVTALTAGGRPPGPIGTGPAGTGSVGTESVGTESVGTESVGIGPVGIGPVGARPAGPAGQMLVGDPPAAAKALRERPGLLARIGGSHGTTVLAGPRGVGKTQVAAAHARACLLAGWPVVLWASAESEDGIVAAFDELASAAGQRAAGTAPRAAARDALRRLRTHPGPVLLIYDNAGDADLVRAWTPPVGRVRTVVTTTRQELESLGELVDVGVFTDEEAVAYLGRRTGLTDPDGAAEVAAALGHLPLALAHGAAVIGLRRRHPGYQAYLRHLRRTDTAEPLPRTPGDPYRHAVDEAVRISLGDLAAADPDGRATALLEHLAVLAPAGADPRLLRLLLGADPRADLSGPLSVLADRSLSLPTASAGHTVTHRLVQRVLRDRLRRAGRLGPVIIAAGRAVQAAVAELAENPPGRSPAEHRAALAGYAEHAAALAAHPDDDLTLLGMRCALVSWAQGIKDRTAAIAAEAVHEFP